MREDMSSSSIVLSELSLARLKTKIHPISAPARTHAHAHAHIITRTAPWHKFKLFTHKQIYTTIHTHMHSIRLD